MAKFSGAVADGLGQLSPAAMASDAETILGMLATRAVSPASREAALPVIDPRKYGLSTAASGTVNRVAIQSAIDEACGTADPVTNTRYATRGIAVPAGTYKIDTPINIRSVIGLEFYGVGFVAFQADANMTSVFDINGAAFSRFSKFTLIGSAGVQVDNAFYTYYDTAGSQFPNTANHYEDIVIRNLDFVTGIRAGKTGSGVQVDDDTYIHIIVDGYWVSEAANPGRWQEAFHFGTGMAANNLTHFVYHPRVQNCRYGLNNDITQVAMFGGGFAGGETAILTGTTGFAHYEGIRCETYQRLLTTTNTTANPNISLKNVLYIANTIASDGQWIRYQQAGTMTAENINVQSVPTGIAPIIRVESATANPNRLLVKSFSVQGVDAPFDVDALFSLVGGGTVKVDGYTRMDASAQALGHQDWSGPSNNTQTGTTYTYILNDQYKLSTFSNAGAITVTIPPHSSVAFPVGCVLRNVQFGAGQITFAAGAGVTLTGTPGVKARAQWAYVDLIQTASNVWVAKGDVAA